MAAAYSSSSVPESNVCEGLEFFEANNILLMALMEETQEDEDQYCEEDDRLMNMIQSLEAEIISRSSSRKSPFEEDIEVGQVDGHDCFMSSISWEDMGVVSHSPSSPSSSSFHEEMMDAWSLCTAGGDDNISAGDCYSSSEFYYEVLLENYLPSQEATDVVF